MSRRTSLAAILRFALGALAVTACSSNGTEPSPPQSAVQLMRSASEQYHSINAAVADGFVALSECVASPMGGMGYHYGLITRIQDAIVDPSTPEVLLYEPAPGGGMVLVGVEFMVHEGAWYGAGNSAPPMIDGQTFDPPNPEHPDEALREMYTLHAWVWKDNPSGTYAPFNPQVSCGDDAASHGDH